MTLTPIVPAGTRVQNMDQLPRGRHSLSRGEVMSSQRGRMLRAVAVVVAEKGYGDTVVENIVSVAGVSRKTFYEHFTDVQDCFLQAYSGFGDMILDDVANAVAAAEQVGAAPMRAGYQTVFTFLNEERDLAQAFWLDAISAGPGYAETRERIYGGFAELLRAGYELRRQNEPDLPEPLESSYAAATGMSAELVILSVLSGTEVDVEVMTDDAVTFTLAILQAQPVTADA
ncbi:MAG: TetR/AcrR family transcriptional regulator [Solirubrobacteraceae bacterium]|nr:TetR/AcrR family transcriptional regulator [Solirubrobacteraceae bacterium]